MRNKNSKVARKSLVAKEKISKGELFTYKNITAKRPGGGRSLKILKLINKKSKKIYMKDQFI